MSTVKIITDSASDISEDVAEKYGIDVVPLTIRFDAEEFIDGVELSHEAFWKRLATATDLPSTAAPAPGAFENAFKKAAGEGFSEVICLTISSKLSATYQIAVTAAEAVKETISVSVFDTMACSIGEADLCAMAAEDAKSGKNANDIVGHLNELRGQVRLYATLDTLENLKKGGRIGAAQALLGSMLSIKPLVTLKDGEVKPHGRARTRGKAIDQLVGLLAECPNPQNVLIAHSYAPDIDEFAKRVAETVGVDEVPVSIIGPVVGTHTGPRLLALSFIAPPDTP